MEVLGPEQERLPGREAHHELGHCLEEPEMVGGVGERWKLRRRQLGEQAPQLHSPGRPRRLDQVVIVQNATVPERVGPGAEGERLLVLVRAAHQGEAPSGADLGDEPLDESGLSDAGLAKECENRPVTVPRMVDCLAQPSHLGFPPDPGTAGPRRLGSQSNAGPPPPGRPVRPSCARRPRPKDLVVEPARLGFGFHAQLPLQQPGAELVLADRGGQSALPGVEAHQGPVHRLLGRVERQQADRRLDGALRGRRPLLAREEPAQAVQPPLPQPLALPGEPLLEGDLFHAEAVEQVAAVQRGRAGERVRGPLAQQALEGRDVDVHGGGVERDRLAFGDQGSGPDRGERFAKSEERLPQAGPGVLLSRLPPEQRRELVARVRLAGAESEVCQQSPGLLPRQRQRLSRREPSLEAPEESEGQTGHTADARLPHYSARGPGGQGRAGYASVTPRVTGV